MVYVTSSLVSGCFAVLADLAAYGDEKNELFRRYTLSINGARHLRLQHRIGQIEAKLVQPANEQETSQLHIAQNYLRQKFDQMDIEIKNKILLVIKHV